MSYENESPPTRRRIEAATPVHTARPWPLPRARSPKLSQLERRVLAVPPAKRPALAAELVDSLLADSAPLVEPGPDPRTRLVTFIRTGPGADRCLLQVNRVTDPMDPAETRLEPLPDADLAALTLELPVGWIASYQFGLLEGQPPPADHHRPPDRAALARLAARLGPDPRCEKQLPAKHSPAGQSVVALPGCPPSLRPVQVCWTPLLDDGRVVAPASGATLRLTALRHPEADAAAPLLLCLDGEVWRRDAEVLGDLARRIAEGDCPPLQIAFLEAADPRQRQLDWACEPDESAALLDRVDEALGRSVGTGSLVVAGQSLGGLFAALVAVRHPDRVSAAVAQSPSLWWPRALLGERSPGRWFRELGAARRSAPIALQCGQMEWGLLESALHAREMLRVLDALVVAEYDLPVGGHDVAWWRRTLPDAVSRVVAAIGSAPVAVTGVVEHG